MNVKTNSKSLLWIGAGFSLGALAVLAAERLRASRQPQSFAAPSLFVLARSAIQGVANQAELVRVRLKGNDITLSGSAAEDEIESIVDAVRSLDGVGRVINKLKPHAGAGESRYHS